MVLEKKRIYFARQSDAIYANDKGVKVTVPIYGKKDIGKGLLKQIMKDAGIAVEDLMN